VDAIPALPLPHRLKRLGEALCRGAQHPRAHHANARLLVRDARVQTGQDTRLGHLARVIKAYVVSAAVKLRSFVGFQKVLA